METPEYERETWLKNLKPGDKVGVKRSHLCLVPKDVGCYTANVTQIDAGSITVSSETDWVGEDVRFTPHGVWIRWNLKETLVPLTPDFQDILDQEHLKLRKPN